MSSFDQAFAASDVAAFATMKSGAQLTLCTAGGNVPVDVIEQPATTKNVFLQGGRWNSAAKVFEVKVADLGANGINDDSFLCVWYGKQYRCIGILRNIDTFTITVEPNVNRRER